MFDHQTVLQLANLVAVKYVFTLTVAYSEGLSKSDKASIIVMAGKTRNMPTHQRKIFLITVLV